MSNNEEKQPVYASKTVLTIGSVVAIVLFIIGPVMWAARKEAELSASNIMLTELRSRVDSLEDRVADTDVWRGKLDVILANIAKEISDIKKAVEK